ncbi:MAG: 50S ribosomal protein L6 [Candidatus Andersenbacteria bacterium CG10_big_fil_rev_8_21_14_0_10_54_11]|uniref:Large ribosomal subunit protein uL6 n=1 Tax=Candidatus Andersenbacteria bacterium CG10_big_fil_rev_8_21_14_0_10_54_11 TaxID=1974485 RepID=A0A2M6WYU3_9BACT|nr:MAG: 50S ribosomal protein L6 [Candidatus Andersenbacteria bacterium CG10_big_fil_rev_8_21_14_0_10_54_11]
MTTFTARSRIGKQVIPLPDGVTVAVDGQRVTITGPKGELSYTVHPLIVPSVADGSLTVAPRPHVTGREGKHLSALWGTSRARLRNIVAGVNEGFVKRLELHGVGYRAAIKGAALELTVGYSHAVTVEPPAGITFSLENDVIVVSGIDAVLVGQVAANIRAVRKPEPYKGKGIRYAGEYVRRKVGKVVGASA